MPSEHCARALDVLIPAKIYTLHPCTRRSTARTPAQTTGASSPASQHRGCAAAHVRRGFYCYFFICVRVRVHDLCARRGQRRGKARCGRARGPASDDEIDVYKCSAVCKCRLASGFLGPFLARMCGRNFVLLARARECVRNKVTFYGPRSFPHTLTHIHTIS